jgi:hypothetical protein
MAGVRVHRAHHRWAVYEAQKQTHKGDRRAPPFSTVENLQMKPDEIRQDATQPDSTLPSTRKFRTRPKRWSFPTAGPLSSGFAKTS